MSVEINDMNEEDKCRIEELIEKNKDDFTVWKEYYDDTVLTDFFWNYKTDRTIVARKDGEIVGFACYQPNSSREDIPMENPFAYFSLILVDEEYRGQGIGTKIIEEIITRLEDSDESSSPIVFSTWESNKTQINVAEKFGFEQYDRKENHRYNGESSLYFRRPLNT